jgi:L-aspartate oxidase
MDWLSSLGMAFDYCPSGNIELGREGGHQVARILHSGGTATGHELQRVLLAQVTQHPRIDLFTFVTAVDFVKDSEGRVSGAVCMQSKRGQSDFETVIFEATEVLLATGGGGQLYRETTNPQLATADGLAMALRAGAVLQDLEFVQFHPTILYLAGAARFLISEVVRGEGAILRNRAGHAFMQDYHADRELAPRDVVSRAIYQQMFLSGDTHVNLDLSSVTRAEEHFPSLARIAAKFGIFIGSDPVPVRPAVHYLVGGVASDLDGQTSIPGLWAVGECASTGFHGANRMGSNSLLEALAHGRIVGRKMSELAGGVTRRFLLPPGRNADETDGVELNLTDITYSLKSLMWRQVGIERDASGLQDAVDNLRTWCGFLSHLGPFTPAGVETANMIQIGMAITRSALFRQESRGAHYRSDFAQTDPAWQVHSRMAFQDGQVSLSTGRVRTPSELSG